MPYSDNQRRQHIAELQKYLHAISLMEGKLPTVVPDGVYGQETTAAVKEFQDEYGLPETGNTDSATWNKIVSVYMGYFKNKPEPFPAFPSEKYVCGKGSDGLLVYIIQAMLLDLGNSFDNLPKADVCGNFNDKTVEAVSFFQKKCGLPCDGKVDCATWNMLVSCCSHKL